MILINIYIMGLLITLTIFFLLGAFVGEGVVENFKLSMLFGLAWPLVSIIAISMFIIKVYENIKK